MNLLLALTLISVILFENNTKASKDEICENNSTEILSTIPNKVFKNIEIITSTDLMKNLTQIEIITEPTLEFHNKSTKMTISSFGKFCTFFEEVEFNLKNDNKITIPQSDMNIQNNELKAGCNYSINFFVENHCIIKFYKIHEPEPCSSFSPENIFNSFPNKIIRNLTVNTFMKNSIRLNISLLPNSEFMNENGNIVLNSKMSRCNHEEEFSFTLNRNNVIVPEAEFPHSFIDVGCEYMIDFQINDYCVTTNYKVPDLCEGKQPQIELDRIIENDVDIFKINWVLKNYSQHNKIKTVYYSLENVTSRIFNSENVLQNEIKNSFSVLDFSQLPKGQTYKLTATFVNEGECYNVIYKEFYLPMDYSFTWKFFLIFSAMFLIILILCVFFPSLHRKTVSIFKSYLFGTMSQLPNSSLSEGHIRREEINLDYIPLELEKCDEFEIPKIRLEIDKRESPKSGNFGIVYLGKVYGLNQCKDYTSVAVKTLRENAPLEEQEALNDEIKTLKKISSHGNHENIVKMFGCCTIEKPKMIILEFIKCGDLKNYLLDLRTEWTRKKCRNRFIFPSDGFSGLYISSNSNRTISETSSNCIPSPTETESTILFDDIEETVLNASISKIKTALSSTELQDFAFQIAKGMAFLEKISVVHRDLAARNVLITENKVLKISDFGMSRIGDYTHRNNGQQPIRWMALESIENFICTSKSDVWSFGVVLWEIGTLGAFPYDNISNECILEHLLYNLKRGIRLMRPEICTDELYSLMLKCWSENPNERLSFHQIVEHLSGNMKKIYLDFKKLNPAYVFPPTKFS